MTLLVLDLGTEENDSWIKKVDPAAQKIDLKIHDDLAKKYGDEEEAKTVLKALLTLVKGGPSSGWYAPPEGTHSGEKHRASGSGKSGTKYGGKKVTKPVREVKTGALSKGDRVSVHAKTYGIVDGTWGATTSDYEGIYLGKVTALSGNEYHKIMDADGNVQKVLDASLYWDESKIEHSAGERISEYVHGKYELQGMTVIKIEGNVAGYGYNSVIEALNTTPEWARDTLDYMVLHEKSGYTFTAGGKEFTAGGDYDSSKDTINIFKAGNISTLSAESIVTHEVGHNVYNDARSSLLQARIDLRNRDAYGHLFSGGKSSDFKDDPKSRTEIAKALKKTAGTHVAAYYQFDASWRDGQDGVTDYSKAWSNKATETWAEMSEIYWTRGTAAYRGAAGVRNVAKDNNAVELGEAFLTHMRSRAAQARSKK